MPQNIYDAFSIDKESIRKMNVNIKKYATLFLAACATMFATTSCEEKAVVKAELTLFATEIQFSGMGETKTIKVKTNGTISCTADYDWLTITSTNSQISITPDKNDSDEYREAIITVRATTQGDYKEGTIKVIQQSKNGTPSGAVYIKDANFADYVLKYYDRDQDGFLQTEEAAMIKEIDVSEYDQTIAPIKTLEGIEHFSNLEILYCNRAGLQGVLDLSNLRKLQHIECDHNEITELKIAQCPAITSLICEFNKIEKLDIKAAGCTQLTFFNCQGNKLKTLDCSGFTKLQHLYCAFNEELSTLTTTNLQAMTTLACHKTNLTSVKLQDMPMLEFIQCNDSNLTELDLKGMDKLQSININSNYIQELDVTDTPKLKTLNCGENLLSSIKGLAGLNNLVDFDCSNNLIETAIELSGKSGLKNVNVSSNKIKSLTLTGCPNVISLICSDAKLKTLDVSGLPNLEKLDCQKNELTTLDVSANSKLKTLYAKNNSLTELWLAEGQKIEDMKLDDMGVIKYKGNQQGSKPGNDADILDYTGTF